VVVLSLVLVTCGRPESTSDAVFEVQYCGESFSVQVTNREQVTRAAQLVSSGERSVVSGRLAHGDGGVNAPWSWHLHPETVVFAEFGTEVCDGCPRAIESDLSYWVDRLGRYCPLAASVTKRLR
jgi:hypothetical protein